LINFTQNTRGGTACSV